MFEGDEKIVFKVFRLLDNLLDVHRLDWAVFNHDCTTAAVAFMVGQL